MNVSSDIWGRGRPLKCDYKVEKEKRVATCIFIYVLTRAIF